MQTWNLVSRSFVTKYVKEHHLVNRKTAASQVYFKLFFYLMLVENYLTRNYSEYYHSKSFELDKLSFVTPWYRTITKGFEAGVQVKHFRNIRNVLGYFQAPLLR